MNEVIVVDFIEAYKRKEARERRRIPYTLAAVEIGIPYNTLQDYVHKRTKSINFRNLKKLMDWLGTTDFNDVLKRQ